MRIIFITSIRKILAYSSITHLSWIILPLINNSRNWIIYIFSYSIIILTGILLLKKINLSTIFQFKFLRTHNSYIILIFFLRLRGLPPFLGFFPKLIVILSNSVNMLPILTVLIFRALLNCYFYIRIFSLRIFYKKSFRLQFKLTNNFILVNLILIIFFSFLFFFLF